MKNIKGMPLILFILLFCVNTNYAMSPDKLAVSSTPEVSTCSEIILMEDDCSVGGLANMCCPYWNVSVSIRWLRFSIDCSTGGDFKCKDDCNSDAEEIEEPGN